MQFHLSKLDVLKLPLKRLLGGLHIQLNDLVHASDMPGIEIANNDIFFDTQKLLPPPHIHGQLTSVRVVVPDIEVVYGGAKVDQTKLAQWHNFLRLSGGTIDFGKLTMHNVDLTMIDASTDPWFDLDLVNYQEQLVNGYTRMTPQAGLEIFMPDVDEQAIHKNANHAISLEWLKNRNKNTASRYTSEVTGLRKHMATSLDACARHPQTGTDKRCPGLDNRSLEEISRMMLYF